MSILLRTVTSAVCAVLCVFGLDAAVCAQSVRVGAILPLMGDHAQVGEIQKNSFLLALDEINAAGGVHGRRIELRIEDDMGKTDMALSAVEKLTTKDGVLVLTGGYSSQLTFAMCGVAEQKKVPFVVTTAAADSITEQGWDYIFRIKPPVSEYPKALAGFLTEVVKPRTVVVLYENSMFGQSSAKEISDQCSGLGIKVLLKEGYELKKENESGYGDYRHLIVKVRAANPDFVYMISYQKDAAQLMKQFMELGYQPQLFVGGGAGFTLPEFPKNAGRASERERFFRGFVDTSSEVSRRPRVCGELPTKIRTRY